jgi:hypothetical protein
LNQGEGRPGRRPGGQATNHTNPTNRPGTGLGTRQKDQPGEKARGTGLTRRAGDKAGRSDRGAGQRDRSGDKAEGSDRGASQGDRPHAEGWGQGALEPGRGPSREKAGKTGNTPHRPHEQAGDRAGDKAEGADRGEGGGTGLRSRQKDQTGEPARGTGLTRRRGGLGTRHGEQTGEQARGDRPRTTPTPRTGRGTRPEDQTREKARGTGLTRRRGGAEGWGRGTGNRPHIAARGAQCHAETRPSNA